MIIKKIYCVHLIFVLLSVAGFSCKKKEVKSTTAIIAGDDNSTTFLVTNTAASANAAVGTETSKSIDMNGDGAADLIIFSRNRLASGVKVRTECFIRPVAPHELGSLADAPDNRMFPPMLEKGALITDNLQQYSGKDAVCASSVSDSVLLQTIQVKEGLGKSNKYIPIKIKQGEWSRMGWIKVSVDTNYFGLTFHSGAIVK